MNNKEWFSSVPYEIKHPDPKSNLRIAQDENIFNLSLVDFLDHLQTTGAFNRNPTPEHMEKQLNDFLNQQLRVCRKEAGYFIKNIVPVFLKDELKEV
jgi:hypothetical protein